MKVFWQYTLSIAVGLGLVWYVTAWTPTLSGSTRPMLEPGSGPGTSDSAPAVPYCEGAGCGALQQYRGNGLRVLHVTNLNAGGNNSFDSAMHLVEADSNKANKQLDIIVFDTAGVWQMSNADLQYTNIKGLYIACHSAPGEVVFTKLRFYILDGSNDIVIRGCAFRGTYNSATSRLVYLRGMRRAVLLESAITHGAQRMFHLKGDTAELYGPSDSLESCTRFVSISHNEIGWGGNQGTNFFINGSPRPEPCISQVTVIDNYVHHGNARLPNVAVDTAFLHQHLALGWQGTHGTQATNQSQFSITYSHYKRLPGSNTIALQADSSSECPTDTGVGDGVCTKDLYLNKNRMPQAVAYEDSALSQDSIWNGSKCYVMDEKEDTCQGTSEGWQKTTAFPYNMPFGWDTLPITTAEAAILDSVGPWRRVDSTGTWQARRDSTLKRAIASYEDSLLYFQTGDDDHALFSVPAAQHVIPKFRDADNDGMPDKWEETVANGYGDNTLPNDSITASGYFTIELWLAGIKDLSWDPAGGSFDPPPTYGDNRSLYLMSLQVDTFIYNQGQDTIISRGIDPDSQPTEYRLYELGTDKGYAITYDTLASWPAEDSAAVDDTLSTRGLSPNPALRDVAVPGQP